MLPLPGRRFLRLAEIAGLKMNRVGRTDSRHTHLYPLLLVVLVTILLMYFGYGVITWEWREGVRSWVFPAFFGRRDASNGWGETGGYSHLHRNVPIVLILNVSDFKKEASSFDSVILPLRLRETLNTPGQGFKLERCWNGVCLYRRPGFCSPPADQHEINGALKLTGY
jgi:hypothetical protein